VTVYQQQQPNSQQAQAQAQAPPQQMFNQGQQNPAANFEQRNNAPPAYSKA